jgi:SAM-dependent methyltransferase
MNNYNTILYDPQREYYRTTIAHIEQLCPEMHKRKMERANIQQAFVYETVNEEINVNMARNIFCAGYYEDTAYEALKANNILNLQGIDPKFDYTLHQYCELSEKLHEVHNQISDVKGFFDVAFSTSVIEHVEDDKEFLTDFISLIKPGGLGVLTLDFQFGYKPGDPLPPTTLRFYTEEIIKNELVPFIELSNCILIGEPNWHDGQNDFEYEGINYCFATLIFRKNNESSSIR